MLRQLWRLCNPVGVGDMLAPAVYAERAGREWRPRQAAERGYEGVACVDDAARLAVLLLRGYERHGHGWCLRWAERVMRFVTYMQRSDGSFANFVLSWDGEPNLEGPTSRPGGLAWLARAMRALAVSARVTGDADHLRRYELAAEALPEDTQFTDVLALAALSGLELSPEPNNQPRERIELWCERVARVQRDGLLLNAPGQVEPHLWGFIQPGVLALAARELGRPEWLELAERSTRDYLLPIVESRFDRPTTLPYEVSSVVFDLDCLHLVTEDPVYSRAARDARDWFHGRNTASLPVYDRERGMVFDGVDDGVVSANSGAESNVEAGLALFDELPWGEYDFPC